MQRKSLALSALILSQSLTQMTTEAFAANLESTMKLTSENFSIGGKEYNLVINLAPPEDPEDAYQWQAEAQLNQKDDATAYFDDSGQDGKMIFELKSSEDGKNTYVGSSCSSSFTGCEEFSDTEQFVLIHDQNNNSWHASVKTTFVSYKEGELEADFTVSLNQEDVE